MTYCVSAWQAASERCSAFPQGEHSPIGRILAIITMIIVITVAGVIYQALTICQAVC